MGIFRSCIGSEPKEMKQHVKNILTLPGVNRTNSEFKTEVFMECVSRFVWYARGLSGLGESDSQMGTRSRKETNLQ